MVVARRSIMSIIECNKGFESQVISGLLGSDSQSNNYDVVFV